jgi:hypothetical protein
VLEYSLCTIGLRHKYPLDTLGTFELWMTNGRCRQTKPLVTTHKVDEQVIMISVYAMSSRWTKCLSNLMAALMVELQFPTSQYLSRRNQLITIEGCWTLATLLPRWASILVLRAGVRMKF